MIDFDKILGPRNSLPPSSGVFIMLHLILFWFAMRWFLGSQYFTGAFGNR